MNDWLWVAQQELEARLQNNNRILKLVSLARTGGDSQYRLGKFREGLHIATEHKLPCWKLFFHRWICELLFYDIDDLPQALQEIVHMAAIAPQPAYRDCPSLPRALFIVVDIYYEIEPLGYEEKILSAIAYMEEHIQLTPMVATHCTHRRGELAYHNGNYDEAISYAQQILSKQSQEFAGAAHRLLRTVYFAQGKIQEAYQQAQLMAQVSRYNMVDTADALLWQAALAQRQGSTQTALFAYLRGQDLYTRHDLPRWIEPYDAICDYLEQSQQVSAALKIRAEQVETYKTYGSEWYESHANLEYCRLLGRMGMSLEAALDHARTVAETMVKPEAYRAELRKIESGDYHQFDWQI